MNRQSIRIDPLEWEALAYKHVYAYRRKFANNSSLEDLFQSAMLGIVIASEKFKEDKQGQAGFAGFAYWYVQRELNLMHCKLTTIGDKRKLIANISHVAQADVAMETGVPEDKLDLMGQEDDIEETVWIAEVLQSLPLNSIELEYFLEMVEYGDVDATELFKERTGKSRQRIHQIRIDIKEKVKSHYERLEA